MPEPVQPSCNAIKSEYKVPGLDDESLEAFVGAFVRGLTPSEHPFMLASNYDSGGVQFPARGFDDICELDTGYTIADRQYRGVDFDTPYFASGQRKTLAGLESVNAQNWSGSAVHYFGAFKKLAGAMANRQQELSVSTYNWAVKTCFENHYLNQPTTPEDGAAVMLDCLAPKSLSQPTIKSALKALGPASHDEVFAKVIQAAHLWNLQDISETKDFDLDVIVKLLKEVDPERLDGRQKYIYDALRKKVEDKLGCSILAPAIEQQPLPPEKTKEDCAAEKKGFDAEKKDCVPCSGATPKWSKKRQKCVASSKLPRKIETADSCAEKRREFDARKNKCKKACARPKPVFNPATKRCEARVVQPNPPPVQPPAPPPVQPPAPPPVQPPAPPPVQPPAPPPVQPPAPPPVQPPAPPQPAPQPAPPSGAVEVPY